GDEEDVIPVEQAVVPMVEPLHDLRGAQRGLRRGLGPRDHEEQQAVQVVEDDQGPPADPQLALFVVAPVPADPAKQRARWLLGHDYRRRGAHLVTASSSALWRLIA